MMFRNPFLKKYVQLNLKQYNNTMMPMEGESVVKSTVAYKGYLLAMDKEFYYMGDDKTKVAFGVPRSEVSFVEILVENIPVKPIKGKTFLIEKTDHNKLDC